MSTEKRFEVLDSLPAYGPMHVSISDRVVPFYSEGYVVRFYRTDRTSWVANFQPGCTKLDGVLELKDTAHALVIASGTCYLMSPDAEAPVRVFGGDYEAALAMEDGRVVLQRSTELTIVEKDGAVWHTARISWDGLREVVLKGSVVTGLAYSPTGEDDEWTAFGYDIDAKRLTRGSFPAWREKVRPWWKIW